MWGSDSDIREEYGDLFSAPSSTSLAHCVSSDLKMGAGIAVHFRKKFGCVDALKDQRKSVGEVAYLRDGSRYIFYLITKQWFYDKPTEKTLARSLVEMRELCDKFGVRTLAMPRIGCGLDGLQWPIVHKMIREIFSSCDMKVTIYSIPDKKSNAQNFLTPNLNRTQEKFRNFFDRRPASLPAISMISKRKRHFDTSDDDLETPKKRMKDSQYQMGGTSSQQTSKRSQHYSEDNFRSKFTQAAKYNTSFEDNGEGYHSSDRRQKQMTSSPSSKSFSSASVIDKSKFRTHTPLKIRDAIPFLSEEDSSDERCISKSRRSSYHMSDRDYDEVSYSNKKVKYKEFEKYSSGEEEESSNARHRAMSGTKMRTFQLAESPDCETDCDRKKERKSRDSSRSEERKSRDPSKTSKRQSRASSRSVEREPRDSSRSEERKSRELSKSKERKSRTTSKSKERKSRDSSKSKERKSRDSSRSKERKSRDSSKSKERKSRDRSTRRERKYRDSSGSRERDASASNKNHQHSDLSDIEIQNGTPSPCNVKERYQSYEENSEEDIPFLSKKITPSSHHKKETDSTIIKSVTHEAKKHFSKYPSLNIKKSDTSSSKPASTGRMYSDRENADGSIKSRLSFSRRPL